MRPDVVGSAVVAVPSGLALGLPTLLGAAEAVGVASWCVGTAAEWARTREQFDRPIGQFQAVKHRCADALCRLEMARAALFDAAGAQARAVEVRRLEIDGDAATAAVRPDGGIYDGERLDATLVRKGDAWKVDRLDADIPVGP